MGKTNRGERMGNKRHNFLTGKGGEDSQKQIKSRIHRKSEVKEVVCKGGKVGEKGGGHITKGTA